MEGPPQHRWRELVGQAPDASGKVTVGLEVLLRWAVQPACGGRLTPEVRGIGVPLIGRRGRRLGITRWAVEKLKDNFEVPSWSGAQRTLSVWWWLWTRRAITWLTRMASQCTWFSSIKRVRMGNTQSICVMIVALRAKLTLDLTIFWMSWHPRANGCTFVWVSQGRTITGPRGC